LEQKKNGGELMLGGDDDLRNTNQTLGDKQSHDADENRPDHDAATAA